MLPTSWAQCRRHGWTELDVLLITGDAYVDHPSFGVALIGRLLTARGLRVAILAQPRYDSLDDFQQFPAPRLFCGITAGNLDSIVANYSGNGKVRDHDAYSPGGHPWRSDVHSRTNRWRPDRASLIYSNLARQAFGDTPLVLGGIEASLRRFVHFDYQQQKLRASLLTDAKADLLVYGMGERAVLEIAERRQNGEQLAAISGSCERLTDTQLAARHPQAFSDRQRYLLLSSHQELLADPRLFLDTELRIDQVARSGEEIIVLQRQQNQWIVQHQPAAPFTTVELDALYGLPYSRRACAQHGPIPALAMIANSVTIVRGCSGNCSFCAITRHQGAIVQSRSRTSIVEECRQLASAPDFSGTITDLGGPTANLYGTSCRLPTCRKHDCLYPRLCKNLQINEQAFLELLNAVAAIEGVRHLFVSSGLRMELLLKTPELLRRLLSRHCPGMLKIAPEHSCDDLLRLMHKEPHTLLERFVATCRNIGKEIGQPVRLSPYLISAHPGSTMAHARQLADDMEGLKLPVSSFQDFTPSPGTISTAMYVSGLDRHSRQAIFVARDAAERMRQRQVLAEKIMPREEEKKRTRRRKPPGKA